MTYKELAQNPKDGIYKVKSQTHIFVVVEKNKLVHVPHGMIINDDEILEKISE